MCRAVYLSLALLLVAVCLSSWAYATNPQDVAARVDSLLSDELQLKQLPDTADDETFLRRVSLDIVGQLPTADEITRFVLRDDSDKRPELVDRLLDDQRYGRNWAQYWRDVILYRRSDERALIAQEPLARDLAEQFNKNTPWDEIARSFITATGDVRKTGSTAIIMAQMADPSDTTAEISRIFLGVQIQCAQCHNHPTDRWKREQFHQLAAFFPRIGIRPLRNKQPRSFEVVSFNKPAPRRAPGATTGTKLEHYMPDLEDPDADGKLMRPVFFATGQSLPLGMSDSARREKLAEWMTARGNGWFAKAIVNRIWGELVGSGFYEPVDDLGPDRKPTAPKTLDYLSREFVASHYDLKWLFHTVTATRAYQSAGRSPGVSTSHDFLANCPQRVRADVLFNNLVAALEVGDASGPRRARPRAAVASPRGRVNQTFGFDPSFPRDEVAGTIPQALFLMNAPDLARAIDGGRGDTVLGRLLKETSDDSAVIQELYLRILARQPKDAETKTCREYLASESDRTQAFEDIAWSLVNSAEFLHRN